MLRKEAVLPELLNTIVKLQKEDIFKDFILGGGTGLALQIGHRESYDIDLFSQKELENKKILDYLLKNYSGSHTIYNNEEKNILQVTIDKAAVDFVSIPAIIVENPVEEDGIKMFGLKDIAAMKLRAIVNKRNKAKDFDICYLLQHFSLGEMFEYYKVKYHYTDAMYVKKALAEGYSLINPYEWQGLKMIRNDFFLSDSKYIIDDAIIKYNVEHDIRIPRRRHFRR
jgi:hypothetical protein